jgi:hypothetical protein
MNPSYPEDLYDDDDYLVEKRMSELRKEMYAHIIMGFGLGVMFTVGLATAVAWFMGL